MRKIVTILILISVMMSCNESKENVNPLLSEWKTPYETPPFEKIKNEDYKPAFEFAIISAKKEVEAIAENKEAPTFTNTIEALENSGKLLSRISSIFFNLNEAATNDSMQNIAEEIMPLFSDFTNDIYLNEKLFERVKTVKEKVSDFNLNTEQQTLLDNTFRKFTRSGANLSPSDKEIFRGLSKDLAMAELKFSQNVLAATNAYSMHLTEEKDLIGLPDGIKEAAAADAKAKNMEGWLITLQYPSYVPFLKYSENRDLREKLYRVYNTRCIEGENSNLEIIKKITNLRLQKANILGFKCYADYSLEETMAQNEDHVNQLLSKLLAASKPVAVKEIDELQKYATSLGAKFKLMPWDLSFYSEKLKATKFHMDDEMTRPYFKLENVIQGVFELTNKLYGLNYELDPKIQLYHPDVRAYKVTDSSNKMVAILYLDFFPRNSKRGGAWMTEFRGQSNQNGVDQRPFISLVCNFTKPTETKPSLLTYSEVETFLHEFGHGLHGMLSECQYESLSGTNVYRDFVELPSQIMENWGVEKEFLDLFAEHYETKEKIPAELVDKIVGSSNFMEGYASVRQLNFGRLDMAYHTLKSPLNVDVFTIEREATSETQVLPVVEGTLISTSFSHIFAGGYAAGYYSYKWSEVLDADAFSIFKEKGIFDKETATSFRYNVLSRGGTENPMELYKRFRGQEPTTDALLKRSGFTQ